MRHSAKTQEANALPSSGRVDVNRAEIDARTIYDLFSIREESIGATREDVEAKAIALRNFNFVSAVAELIAAVEAEDAAEQGSHEWQLAHDRKIAAIAALTEPQS